MESEFLDELIESDLIISAEGFINSNIIYSLYDTLLSFDNLGVDEDAIKLLLEENEVKNYNYNLKSKRANFKKATGYEVNLIMSDEPRVDFENSYYKISRVGFNHLYTEAIVAIEFVCYDCGGLTLYKFKLDKSGKWVVYSNINIWMS
ncbi:hypothetical protein [Algoriphagus sp. Y33]|uniref:hypothetical protein n=1 Tax=Algoriphagus sp. Y33 TaxID=2772483 RepID=UPI001784E4AF|nr:hypothetical protein [Algoriphagus sp. Y33]